MPGLVGRTLSELAAFGIGALALGSLVLRPLGGGNAPLRLLVGLGATGYLTILLSLAHALRWWTLLLVTVAVAAVVRRDLRPPRLPRGDRVTLALTALAAAMACGQLLAALAPPEAYDELAYHLPYADAIRHDAAQQLFHASGPYANFPSLGEAISAAALTVDGAALAHALHLAVLLAFVALAATVVRELAGARAGAFSAVALLAYPDLTYNATTAYVDAAATSFELAAVLLVVRWLHRGGDLRPAALVLGLALSVKYTALFAAAVLGAVVAVVLVRRRDPRTGLTALGIVVATGGFWYAKSLVRFGNPIWPFYSHRGMDDRTYADLVAGIRSFGPRTAGGFVELPWRVASDASLIPFLALSLVAVALLAPRARAVAAYAALYVTNWYWIATHQLRFLLSGVAAAILAVTIAVATGGRTLRIVLACMAVAAVALTQARVHPFSVSGIDGAIASRFGSPKARYALGLESRQAYLKRYLGCTADAVAYLDARPELAPTLVPQTALAPNVGLRARFGKLPLESRTPAAALRAVGRGGFRSVLLLGGGPWNLATTDRSSGAVLGTTHPVWRRGDCTILVVRLPR